MCIERRTRSHRAPRVKKIGRSNCFWELEKMMRCEKIEFHFQTFSPKGFIYLSGHVGVSSGVGIRSLYQAYSQK